METRERTTTLWMATAGEHHTFLPLVTDITTEVCVVGAGIAGLSAAYELVREGVKVVVLDDGPIAGGQSRRTSAHLSCALDDRYYELERIHGKRGTRLAAQSHVAAIDRIEENCEREGI